MNKASIFMIAASSIALTACAGMPDMPFAASSSAQGASAPSLALVAGCVKTIQPVGFGAPVDATPVLIAGTPAPEDATFIRASTTQPNQWERVTASSTCLNGGAWPTGDTTPTARTPVPAIHVITSNTGAYLAPYTSDGVAAEWVDQSVNAKMGSAAGSAIGGFAGAYAAGKLYERLPGASLLGGMIGSRHGGSAGQRAALKAAGGWTYIRETSDRSFNTPGDLAQWLTIVHGSQDNYGEVLQATLQIYPELGEAIVASNH